MAIDELIERADRDALEYLGDEWHAGPDLPDSVLDRIDDLRAAGLVERQFGDMGPLETDETIDGFKVRVGACWYFAVTEKGRAAIARATGAA